MCSKMAIVVCVAVACCTLGCRGEARPRTQEEIQAERMGLPALYITASGKQITKPGSLGIFVDEATREIAWPAYTCDHPACPGRKPDGGPCLFVWPDPRFMVTPEGTVGTRELRTNEAWLEAVKQAGGHPRPTCPECLKTRNLSQETAGQAEQFSRHVRRYELPETTARNAALDAEWQNRKRP